MTTGNVPELIIALVFALVVFFLSHQRYKAKMIRKARVESARLRTDWPERLGPWLLSQEEAQRENRKHPIAIVWWLVIFYGGPILAFVSVFAWTNGLLFAVLFFGGPLISGWKVLVWCLEWQAITNQRVIEVRGVFNVEAPAAGLNKITTTKPIKPWFSRIVLEGWFGRVPYGHIVIETNAEVEPIPTLWYVRDVEDVARRLQERLVTPAS
jgi:hypothetical protein